MCVGCDHWLTLLSFNRKQKVLSYTTNDAWLFVPRVQHRWRDLVGRSRWWDEWSQKQWEHFITSCSCSGTPSLVKRHWTPLVFLSKTSLLTWLGVSQHTHKITSLWKFDVIWDSVITSSKPCPFKNHMPWSYLSVTQYWTSPLRWERTVRIYPHAHQPPIPTMTID